MTDPIVIMGTQRSGTSLVAAIFRDHNVWMGRAGKVHRPRDYPSGTNENQQIKRLLIQNYGRGEEFGPRPKRALPKHMVTRILAAEGYRHGPWFVKHGAIYAWAWKEFDPKWIFVRRPVKNILGSIERKGGMNPDVKDPKDYAWWKDFIEKQVSELERVKAEEGGVEVFPNEIIQGDYWSLEEAFSFCEVPFKKEIVQKIIRPSIWGVNG